jgi:hypothetical protein
MVRRQKYMQITPFIPVVIIAIVFVALFLLRR